MKTLAFQIQIYDKNNNKCQNLYHILYQPSTKVSPLAFDPRADIRVLG